MNLTKQYNSSFMIFFIIAIVYAIGNFIWLINNTPVIPIMISAIHFNDIFEEGWLFYNAPLITWIMRGMFYVFGKEYYDLIVIFVNYIFFLIPLYFTYKIGVELKDKETGNIAMILFALVPAVYGMSRQYGHKDYHIIAAMTFNIYCLIKTDYFRNRKWTIWYGISVGLGLMIKDAFLAYFFVPFAYIAIAGLREKIEKTKIINILISILIGSLISGWHYFRPAIIQKILNEPVTGIVNIFEFDNLRIITIGLWEELLSPPIFIMFIAGLIFYVFKYRNNYKNIILLWFFVPWLLIVFMLHYKYSEYGAGFIPAIVLVVSIFISCIQKEYIKKFILIFLLMICSSQYMVFSYINFRTIFDIKFQYSKYFIGYYNKFCSISFYHAGNSKFSIKFINFLKNNYPHNLFYIEFDENILLDPSLLLSQVYLNDIKLKNQSDILCADIIIVIGVPKTASQITAINIHRILADPSNTKEITEEVIDELYRNAVNILSEIRKNYHVIDIFYLDDNKNENTKVTLLGRKDKFSEFNEKHAILDVK